MGFYHPYGNPRNTPHLRGGGLGVKLSMTSGEKRQGGGRTPWAERSREWGLYGKVDALIHNARDAASDRGIAHAGNVREMDYKYAINQEVFFKWGPRIIGFSTALRRRSEERRR